MDSNLPANHARKRPSKLYEYEDKRAKKDTSKVAFGQLQYGQYDDSKPKLSIRTFFGNPETEVFCMRFDQEDKYIAAGSSDGSLKIFDLQTNKLEHNLSTYSGANQSPTTSLRWRPQILNKTSQVLVSINSDGTIIHWHAPSGNQVHRIMDQKFNIMCLDYTLDGSKFATAGNDFHIRVYDEELKQLVMDIPPADWNLPGHSNRIFSVKYLTSDPNTLISGGWDSNIHIWDMRTGKSTAVIFGPSVSGDGLDEKDGLILAGSYRNDNQLQLWDRKTHKIFKDIPWNQGKNTDSVYLYAAQFSKINNSTIAAGSSGQNELVVYDRLNEYKPCASVVGMTQGIYSLDYANKTNKIAFGGGEGVAYVMNLAK